MSEMFEVVAEATATLHEDGTVKVEPVDPNLAMVLPLAEAYVKRIDAEFEAEVRDWYDHGDGRPTSQGGRGYRFPTCPHGMSLWTDYDNICGSCEESLTQEERIQQIAENVAHKITERTEWIRSAPSDLSTEKRVELVQWTYQPLRNIMPKSPGRTR